MVSTKTTAVQKINYESWPRKRVSISDLFLDSENIRLGLQVKSSQNALINDLFLNEDAMQILNNIATNGFFPDELPVVIKENDKFVVMEGNRRIAALKVLERPEIVPTKETSVRIILKTAVAIVKSIEVVVAPDRHSVERFLASKHTQNTRRPWRPLRQAYFYNAQLKRGKSVKDLRDEYPTIDIGKFLRLINIHRIAKSISYDSSQIEKKVHNERTFPASTLERLYEDKNVRDFLGFDFDGNGEVRVSISRKEFEKGFKRIVQDVTEKVVDSRALNSEENRREYLAKIPKADIPNKTRATKTITSKDFKEQSPASSQKRKKLAPKDIAFTLQSPGVHRMLIELQGIDYNKFPNAAHDLLRSFLECSLKAYFDQRGSAVKPSKGQSHVTLDTVLKEFKKEMDATKNIHLSQVTQKIISDTKMTSYCAQFLNATNHNPSVFAVGEDVENAWDGLERLLRFILDPKSKSNDQNKPQEK